MKLDSKTKTISAQWLALLTIFGMAVLLVPVGVFAQGQPRDVTKAAQQKDTVAINVAGNDIDPEDDIPGQSL